MFYTDPAQHVTTTDIEVTVDNLYDPYDLYRDLPDVWIVPLQIFPVARFSR